SRFTYSSDVSSWVAVDMDLPVHRSKRCEVVSPVCSLLDPWQAVAAVNSSGAPLAQTAFAVVQTRLRHGAKHQTSHRLEFEQMREKQGNQAKPHKPRNHPRAGHARERAIGCGNQTARKGNSFRLVTSEQ